jgi:hypothetical protein
MKKAKALRLKPGQIITFGDQTYTALCTRVWQGEVLQVTPRGGVKVKVTDEKPRYGRAEYACRYGDNEVRWVPYHHIIH